MALYLKKFNEIQKGLVLCDSPLKAELDTLNKGDAIYSDVILTNNPAVKRIQYHFIRRGNGYAVKIVCFPRYSSGEECFFETKRFDTWAELVLFCWANICIDVPGGGM